MTVPNTLLDLGLTLRPEYDTERLLHVARLAARLGFRYIWLPLPDDVSVPDLAALTESVRPGRVGLVVGGDPGELVQRVTALCDGGPPSDVLLEIHAPAGLRERLVAAVGGPPRWRERAFVPWYDAEAAGHVVLAEQGVDRATIVKALADASGRRGGQGHAPVVSVALTVSIGRTMSEAQARALRDPALSGARHPKIAGLFGTFEHAQEQALELARAGADTLRATLADEQDVADLLAQLRSVAVGPTPLLHARSR
ncbi:hypothetical protein ABZY81_29915 [Streptomyces sp. NPDC006514]|uniref:hypothetical protein n=1 Tax=Streptomyces sp. NPDC006514 TaxID=3154308 RepID=UPI0033B580D0